MDTASEAKTEQKQTSERAPERVVQRVRDLIALARSGDTEEARSAAVQALRLMDEHRLVVLDQAELERRIARSTASANRRAALIGALAYFAGRRL